jgi:tetratricopeptide (TPR) repeat protein
MTFLRRLFGGRGADGYSRAIALVEEGRIAEALPLLREAYESDSTSPQGSLTGVYLRQALVSEGRRLLASGAADSASERLAEATAWWPDYPDLRFLAGCASAASAAWDDALAHARTALRRNPDYCEARLLEAAVLAATDRPREAAESLDRLIESGRRIDHALVRELARDGGFTAADLPDDLLARVHEQAVGGDVKHRLADAVAHCRAGRWDEGLERLAELAARHPDYPDVRAKHGAALYQVGRREEALVELDAALVVNERYRTAVILRGLVLAEMNRLAEAARDLETAVPRLEGTAGRHEELFLAYLRATLALLLGHRDTCRELLAGWNDLGRQFARAELLLVACDDLDGLHDAARRRLDALVETWSSDAELVFLRATLQLAAGQWAAVESAIVHWPGGAGQGHDERPLLLQCRLDVARGREPSLPDSDGLKEAEGSERMIDPAAWSQLVARADLMAGRHDEALARAQALVDADGTDDETTRIWLDAAAALIAHRPELGNHPLATGTTGTADACVSSLSTLWRRGDDGDRAEALVAARRRRRPDVPIWSWLSAVFWLEPVRRWLA